MKSLIIIAHGSRKETSNSEVIKIVDDIKNSDTLYNNIESAFLEFATPTIEQSVKKCIEEKSQEIDIYPYFLNSGKHVTSDIPNVIEELKIKYLNIKFSILPHFGQSKTITKIILSDIGV